MTRPFDSWQLAPPGDLWVRALAVLHIVQFACYFFWHMFMYTFRPTAAAIVALFEKRYWIDENFERPSR